VEELARIVRLWRAYGHAERAEELELQGDLESAAAARLASLETQPDHPELAFWAAIAMAQAGRLDDARTTIAVARAARPGWAELLRRIVADGQIELDDAALATLLADEPS
ncbi:MAG: tetratricopeptide repeat protein, partial [Actinomycetota bacterium]|nr:tetratricopeptide repeat protein [Actinomycetota bacterium]